MKRPGPSARPFQSRQCCFLQLDAEALQDRASHVPVEGLRARHQVDPGEPGPVGVQVGDLLGEVADAVRAGQWCELNGAENADRASGRVHEPAAGVTGDPGADGVDVMAPAAGGVLYHDALLRAERRYSAAQLRVAVRVDRRSGSAPGADAGGTAERRYRRVDARNISRIQLDQG